MASERCVRHPEEKLRFLCQPCNTPICRDCKLTRHEGHPTTDLHPPPPDLPLRQRLGREKEEVEKGLRVATQLRDRTSTSLTSLDGRLEDARGAVKKKVEAVVEWAHTYSLVMDRRMREITQEARAGMESLLDYLDENVAYLDQMVTAMTRALGKESGEGQLEEFFKDYQQKHQGRYPAAWELSMHAASQASVLGSLSSSPDLCQAAIHRYLGLPLMSREVRTVPSSCTWTFSTRVRGQGSVTHILPLNDGSLSVILQESPGKSRLVHYSPEGVKRGEEENVEDVVMAELGGCQVVVFSVDTESWQPHLPQSPGSGGSRPDHHPPLVYLKRGQGGKVSVCELTSPLGRPSMLLTLDFQDGLRVTADAQGQHLAVLRECQQVVVFQRHGGGGKAVCRMDVRSQLDKARLRDVCFGTVQGQERLMVAEAHYHVILITDHLHGCVLLSFFPSPCPLPTCVRADVTGAVWVGGEGGEVVAGLPVSENEEDYDDLEEDPEGYLVPFQNLYVNIMALGQEPSAAGARRGGRPRSEVPELPPRPRGARSAETDRQGMPLTPPPRPPLAQRSGGPHHPAPEQQIRDLICRPLAETVSWQNPDTHHQAASPQEGALYSPTVPCRSDSEYTDLDPGSGDGEPGSGRGKSLPREHAQRELWTPRGMSGPEGQAPGRPPRPGPPPHLPPRQAHPDTAPASKVLPRPGNATGTGGPVTGPEPRDADRPTSGKPGDAGRPPGTGDPRRPRQQGGRPRLPDL